MNCVRILLYFSLSCSQAVWRLHSEPNYTLSMSRVGELCAVCRDSAAIIIMLSYTKLKTPQIFLSFGDLFLAINSIIIDKDSTP